MPSHLFHPPEPVFGNLLRSSGIDSQPGRPAGTTTLFEVTARQESILWNRFLASKTFTNSGSGFCCGGNGPIIVFMKKYYKSFAWTRVCVFFLNLCFVAHLQQNAIEGKYNIQFTVLENKYAYSYSYTIYDTFYNQETHFNTVKITVSETVRRQQKTLTVHTAFA